MTEDELHQQIGETLLHMLPKGSQFVLLYQVDGRPTRTVSTVPADELAEIFEDYARSLRRGRISEPVRHEAWENGNG